MKLLMNFLLILTFIGVISCSKSSGDPETIYTVKYLVTTNGMVQLDTIQYKSITGEFITKHGESKLDYSFTSANGYNASLSLSSQIFDGTVQFKLMVTTDNAVVYIDSTSQTWNDSLNPLTFKYCASKMFITGK